MVLWRCGPGHDHRDGSRAAGVFTNGRRARRRRGAASRRDPTRQRRPATVRGLLLLARAALPLSGVCVDEDRRRWVAQPPRAVVDRDGRHGRRRGAPRGHRACHSRPRPMVGAGRRLLRAEYPRRDVGNDGAQLRAGLVLHRAGDGGGAPRGRGTWRRGRDPERHRRGRGNRGDAVDGAAGAGAVGVDGPEHVEGTARTHARGVRDWRPRPVYATRLAGLERTGPDLVRPGDAPSELSGAAYGDRRLPVGAAMRPRSRRRRSGCSAASACTRCSRGPARPRQLRKKRFPCAGGSC